MTEIDKKLPVNLKENTDEISNIASENYWMNQIKSQEDTARQIVSICVLLLGISITAYTNSFYKFIDFSPTRINVFMSFVFLFSFFFVWVLAIDTANFALKLARFDSYHKESFKKIANLKHRYVSNTMKIIISGLIGLVSLVVYMLLFPTFQEVSKILPDKSLLYLQMLTCMVFLSFMWVISIFIIFYNWPRSPRIFKRQLQLSFHILRKEIRAKEAKAKSWWQFWR